MTDSLAQDMALVYGESEKRIVTENSTGPNRMDVPDARPVSTEASCWPEMRDPKRARAKGFLTEQPDPARSTQSITSCEDVEKGEIALTLAQQDVGTDDYERLDATQLPCGYTSTVVNHSAWRRSILPREMPKLPPQRERRIWRVLRYKLVTAYQRLFSIVFIANMIALTVLLVRNRDVHTHALRLADLGTAAAANILAAILIRQENVINILYDICCMTPMWWPLPIRRTIAKIYHLGGVHSGCACSAVAWFGLFTSLITMNYVKGDFDEPAVVVVTYILLTLFVIICVFAIPTIRLCSHNTFEQVHRFAGWTAVGLFWVETLLVLNLQAKLPGADSLGIIVIKSPTFWILLGITFFIILPWVRLRKVDAFPEILSSHAVRIRFKYMKIAPVFGLRITDNPLKEWHAFATIPEADGSSFSMIVSNAGDWTHRQISHPARKYWVRGIPITGIIRMAEIFRKVVLVTTGSGIGPCLSMLSSRPSNCRILWSTPNPLQTYGQSVIEEVLKADPEAIMIDTRVSGRPDMVVLTYHLYLEAKAEAVFVVSNPSLTRKVVYAMESRGIPAFGPIWDS